MVCFMGPNGIGKSTLLRTLAGLQAPLSGEIKFDVGANKQQHFENVAVVLTDPVTATNMTVQELITLGRYPYISWNLKLLPADKKIVDQSIQRVNIHDLAHKKLEELSDGQRQMAMIARALAQDTPIILLDEPTSHLDLNNRIEIMRFLKNLARTTGKAILIATHELDLALQTADVLWLAHPDKTIRTGLPEDLILNGSLDDVFKFKGYDLKTGKIDQEPHRGIMIQLSGEGYEYRWTKNALERSGFMISQSTGKEVTIGHGTQLSWRVQDGKTYFCLEDLLDDLKAES
jgi:iron complex transport system ATP-binding protein